MGFKDQIVMHAPLTEKIPAKTKKLSRTGGGALLSGLLQQHAPPCPVLL